MERYTYFDGGKWRMRVGDAEYSGKETERLAAYEETGLKPEAVERAKLASMGKAIAEIKEFEGVPIDRLRNQSAGGGNRTTCEISVHRDNWNNRCVMERDETHVRPKAQWQICRSIQVERWTFPFH